MEEFGFVAEPHKNGYFLCSPAIMKDGNITVYDLSGFGGSWGMREGGKFFKCPDGDKLCKATMEESSKYCKQMNGEK